MNTMRSKTLMFLLLMALIETHSIEARRVSSRVKRGVFPRFLMPRRRFYGSGTARISSAPQTPNAGVVPAVVKVVNVISDIGHGAQKVAKRVSKDAEPIIKSSAASWRRTVDEHIMPNVQSGLNYVGEKAVEGLSTGVDAVAEAVMGAEAKEETAEALKTLHTAWLTDNSTAQDDYYYAESQQAMKYDNEANHYNQYQSYYDSGIAPTYFQTPDLIQPRREYPNSIRLQQPIGQPAAAPNKPFTVEEALYVLGKNVLGRNVTDRLFPVAKTLAKGMGQVGEGLSTFTELLPPLEFDGSPLKLLPGSIVVGEQEYYDQQQQEQDSRPRNERDQSSDLQHPTCTTPSGTGGRCMDIQDCPILLADLSTLRKSICFKSLFVPGVCCPTKGVTLIDFGGSEQKPGTSSGSNDVGVRPGSTASIIEDFDVPPPPVNIQPQGTTKRPQLPSLQDLPSTTPRPSPLLQRPFRTVPGSNQECGSTKIPQSRIVGGNATFEGEHPWMVAIYLHGNNRKEFWCGGALISPTTVITAAHCTKDGKKRPFRPGQFTARVGEWDLSDSDNYSGEFRIIHIEAHPDFKANGFYNDVALFTLDQPVRFSEYIQPVCLPSGSLLQKDFTGKLPVVLGWGTTHYGGEEVSTLRGVSLPVWTRSDCDHAYFQPITEVFLCAGFAEGGRDACQGDSGGPLVLYEEDLQRWVLLGIVSFGNRCAEPGYPGVYTRVTHFMPWVLQNMT